MAVKEYQDEEVIQLKPREKRNVQKTNMEVISPIERPIETPIETSGDMGNDSEKEMPVNPVFEPIEKPLKVQEEQKEKKKYSFQPIMQDSINYVRLNDLHGSPLGGRQVFLITSTKGGVGKTTLTLNLANILQSSTKGRVVVVDFMQPHGNIATRLLIKSVVNVKSWEKYMLQNTHLTDRQIFEELVVKEPRRGFYLVPGIHYPENITPELAEYIIRYLSQVFDFVIVDIGPEQQDVLTKTMNMANRVFMVIDYDITTIHDSQQYLINWQNRKLNIDKVSLIVNFEPIKKEKNRISKNSCTRYFEGMPVVGFIPEIQGMRGIHNEGKLITEVQPKGAYAKELKKIFSQYISDVQPEKSGLLARIFGRR